ncbi:hypothetical protein SEA_MISCHIEF19_5 [Streptomyces phage Mischief19]|nr:hypothetical protein SEA_MISCHIEF19_5 [Streptomyces phage Mischief19]
MWDLRQLLAAYVAQLKRSCEDEAEWRRLKQQLNTEPIEIRRARLDAQRAAARGNTPAALPAAEQQTGVSMSEAEAFLAAVMADDEAYGTG